MRLLWCDRPALGLALQGHGVIGALAPLLQLWLAPHQDSLYGAPSQSVVRFGCPISVQASASYPKLICPTGHLLFGS